MGGKTSVPVLAGYQLGCVQISEAFVVTRKLANFPFSCGSSVDGGEYLQTVLKLSFGSTKMAAYANKSFVCLFATKIWK